MTAQVWRVDRTRLHKPAWNCHADCASVVMLTEHEHEVSRWRSKFEAVAEMVGRLKDEPRPTPASVNPVHTGVSK